MINKIIHGCLEKWNFSSRVRLDISLVRCTHLWDIKMNTRREIPCLRGPMRYSLLIKCATLTLTPFLSVHTCLCASFSSTNRQNHSNGQTGQLKSTMIKPSHARLFTRVLVPGSAEPIAREASRFWRVFGFKQVVKGQITSTRKLYIFIFYFLINATPFICVMFAKL